MNSAGKTGCSTYCLMDRPLGEALEILSGNVELVEILSDGLHDLMATGPRVCLDYPFSYTVHAPCADVNIASPNPFIRESSCRLIGTLLETCAGINAALLVVHPGYTPWKEATARSGEALRQSLPELASIQEEHGIPVAVENMGSWNLCHFRDPGLLPFIRDLGLSWTLDVGHANLTGTLWSFLGDGQPAHVHLHDNHGQRDDHLGIGEGAIPFSRVLPAISHDARWIVEVSDPSAVSSSLDALSRGGRAPPREDPPREEDV